MTPKKLTAEELEEISELLDKDFDADNTEFERQLIDKIREGDQE